MTSEAAAATAATLSPLPLVSLTLVLGGARAGKSAYAESLIMTGPAARGLYLATGSPGDAEMAARIAEHRARRGPGWVTVEEPLELARALAAHASAERPVLVDCLTLWLSNLMHEARDVEPATRAVLDVLPGLAGPVVFVANEVGLGIVPDNALARRFRDAAGVMNQTIARVSDEVEFVVAGLPMRVK